MLNKIQKLKELFDHSSPELRKDYWTPELLEIYADTLGERIRWKWNSFLKDLKDKNIFPESLFSETIIFTDWGCGPGTASFAVAEASTQKHSYEFFDRSNIAMAYATKRLEAHSNSKFDPAQKKTRILLLSYVLSELSKIDEAKLIEKIFSFDAVLWVDAGTHKESRRLSEIRNTLSTHFDFLAPCPHSKSCPLSGTQNPNDWCHRFADAPQEAFHSAKWAEISKVLKIDLRSLPYSSLYGVKKSFLIQNPSNETRLGRPRVGKHEITLEFCTQEATYIHKKVTKRENPELFKKLRKE